MAKRRPLVMIDGKLKELPQGDVIGGEFIANPTTLALTHVNHLDEFTNTGNVGPDPSEFTIAEADTEDGDTFSFYVENAFGIKITPDEDMQIYYGNYPTTAETGFLISTSIGSSLELKRISDTKFFVVDSQGNWGIE